MFTSIHIIYASTGGNTEHAVDTLMQFLHMMQPDVAIECQRVELAHPKDLLRGDILILGCGTCDTGGVEGQLNMHMHALLREKAKNLDLQGKPITFIRLGDDRYHFRTRRREHFLRFQREHNGTLFIPRLVIVNEPYGQEEQILQWTQKLVNYMVRGKAAHIRKNAYVSTPSRS